MMREAASSATCAAPAEELPYALAALPEFDLAAEEAAQGPDEDLYLPEFDTQTETAAPEGGSGLMPDFEDVELSPAAEETSPGLVSSFEAAQVDETPSAPIEAPAVHPADDLFSAETAPRPMPNLTEAETPASEAGQAPLEGAQAPQAPAGDEPTAAAMAACVPEAPYPAAQWATGLRKAGHAVSEAAHSTAGAGKA